MGNLWRTKRNRGSGAVLCCLFCAILLGCQSAPSTSAGSQTLVDRGRQSSASASRHDLSQDEDAGGHTLRKHVGRSDEQLQERLRHERGISAASTWNDRASAELAVGAALAQSSDRINRWLGREGGHPNLVLDYDGDAAHPFGRTMRRGEDVSSPCAQALIVLKWDGANSYHVLTAYPECRS